jgi:beta-galactosidase
METYDGFQNRYGWYRTILHRDVAGPLSLHFSGKSGSFAVFLNGQSAFFDKLDAKAGDNTLAILAKAGPRATLYNFTGPIGTRTIRGLWGTVSTSATGTPLAQSVWYFHGGLAGLDETPVIGTVTNWTAFLAAQPWQTGAPSAPGLPTFYKATLTYHHPAGMRETIGLQTGSGLKTGHVWLNGHNLGECPQKVPMYIPECWLKEGDNDLVLFDLYGGLPDQAIIIRNEIFAATPAGS